MKATSREGRAQCLSVAPQPGLPNKAQWLHCQQASSCTFTGLPDTRPLLFFLFFFFKQSAQQPFEEEPEQRPAPPERGHSALDGRCSRLFLSPFFPFPPPHFIPRLRLTRSGANGEISATSLLTGPRGEGCGGGIHS